MLDRGGEIMNENEINRKIKKEPEEQTKENLKKETKRIQVDIDGIQAVLWGERSEHVYLAIHGAMSNKEDTVIQIFAEESRGYGAQVLSFDLPEHGDRKQENRQCNPVNCMEDLNKIMSYARKHWTKVGLFACSMGAYFSLLTFQKEELTDCYFLSPVVDMRRVIENMMKWTQVTAEDLRERKQIETSFEQTLYWDYYSYVCTHPINSWNHTTYILYGDQDQTCDLDTEESFADRYHCKLTIVPGAEHYFHTKDQLDTVSQWLQMNMKHKK